ncbi:MAG: hypothetical protein LHW52_03420, partial [Candidatus Cloacimonetes bacterium]|nr:hypothetical protein [Candidatus Cloacimonadota bacterium]
MAKILSLRLNYKGKFLDYAKEGKEIKKNFTIGSNKFLQWQILDPSFPDKHMFIQQKGGEYVMQMLPGNQLSVEKGGNAVDSNYLKQNNLLSGNELVLKHDLKGTLTLSPDWSIEFEYREPWVAILTAEEKQIVAQYARRAKPDEVSRFNRMILWLVLLLAIVFSIIFELFLKPEYKYDDTVVGKLQTLQAEAQRVQADASLRTSNFVQQEAPPQEAPEGDTPQQGTPGATGPRGSAALDAAFAGGFDATATGVAPQLKIVTVVQGYSARRPGAGGGTGSGGAAGEGAGAGSSFNASSTPNFPDIGAAVTKGPSTGLYTQRPEGATEGIHVFGDQSKLAPRGEPWGDRGKQKRVREDYERRGVVKLREGVIAGLSEEQARAHASLRDQVQNRQSQISQAYREANLRQTAS